MRTIVKHSAILIAAALLALLCAGAATAGGPGAGLPSATGGAGSLNSSAFGSWYPQPTSNTTVDVYRGDLVPFNQTTPEALDFSCTYPSGPKQGMPIDNTVLAILSRLFQVSRAVYQDPTQDNLTDSGDDPLDYDPKGSPSSNYPWTLPAGASQMSDITDGGTAMQYYLIHVVSRLKSLNGNNGKTNPINLASLGPDLSGGGNTSNANLTAQQIEDAAQNALFFIPTTDGSSMGDTPGATPTNDPVQLDSLVPFNCQLNEFANDNSALNLHNLLHHPAEWLSNLFAYIPGLIVKGIYGTVEPIAFKYAFWTPHSERGDTIFNSTLDCSSKQQQTAADLSPQADAALQESLLSNKTWCGRDPSTGQVTSQGFSSNRLMIGTKNYNQMPSWIRYSIMAQWLVSATYFIVLFGGAIIFMFRGHRRTAYNVMHMIPRLILAVFLTVFSNWGIGLIISLSNMLVVNLFGSNGDVSSLRALRDVITNMGAFGGGGGSGLGATDALTSWIQVFVVGAADWFLAIVAIASVLRQLLLVVLIIAAPVACFALIHQRWEQKFKDYIRILMIVVAMPPAMALVLKVGLALNPAVSKVAGGENAGFKLGFFGAVMAVVTFALIGKIPKIAWAGIKGGPMLGGGGAMGKMVQRMGKAAMPFAPWLGTAMQYTGAGMSRAGQGLDRVAAHAATLAPDQKIRASHAGGRVGRPTRVSKVMAEGGIRDKVGNSLFGQTIGTAVANSRGTDALRGGAARTVGGLESAHESLRIRAHQQDGKLGRVRAAGLRSLSWGAKHGAGWSGVVLEQSDDAKRKLGEHRALRSINRGVAASSREYRQQMKDWEHEWETRQAMHKRNGTTEQLTKDQFFAALGQRRGDAIQQVRGPRGTRFVRNTVRMTKPMLSSRFESDAVKRAQEQADGHLKTIQTAVSNLAGSPEQKRRQAKSMFDNLVKQDLISPDLAASSLEKLVAEFNGAPAPASADATTSGGRRRVGNVDPPSGVKSV